MTLTVAGHTGVDAGTLMQVTPSEDNATLIEKVRVLTCLYKIAQTVVDDSVSLPGTLQAIVDLIPQAFACPQRMAALIRVDDRAFQTPGFGSSRHRSQQEIVVRGDVRGLVEIGTISDGQARPEDARAYSVEAVELLASAARKVAYLIEREEANAKKKTLEEQLRHADRLATIGQLAAGIAHELNNPLGDILGFAQLASNYPDLPEQVYADLVKIVKSTLYAREVIKKVLFFARQTLPRGTKTDLNQLIAQWVDFFEFRCAQNEIEIVLDMEATLPPVIGDPAQLNQVLVNLVVNAIHAMPGGGTLTIRTVRRPDRVAMQVEDTGQGIPEAIKDKIFMPFFTTKSVDQGTGLGLSVVYGIVTEHGGTVTMHSQEGLGSLFEIELPTT